MTLSEKTNYTSPLSEYNGYIREFDLSKANISALISQNVISKDLYDHLYYADKQYREVYVGKMERDNPEIYKYVSAGIKEAKKLLFESNDIKSSDIISINNDAVFITGNKPMKTEFGYYKFNIKHTYTHYLKFFNNVKFFYWHDHVNDFVDIKGINETKLSRHQPFIEFIVGMQYMLSNAPLEEAINMYREYSEEYMNKKLPIDNYRELNADNMFRVVSGVSDVSVYFLDIVDEKYRDIIDINYNYSILRDIGAVLTNRYFAKK